MSTIIAESRKPPIPEYDEANEMARILMLTNIYTPQVGGVTRSIQSFGERFRRAGHGLKIVAPSAEGQPKEADEPDVIRVPAIPNFYEDKYSLPISPPGYLSPQLNDFQPTVVHAHHPFLVGATALRIAAAREVPLVYTHHTRYEHYINENSNQETLARLVGRLSSGYANLCDAVIAPSQDVKQELQDAGVEQTVHVIPTGVDMQRFAAGDGLAVRRKLGIPDDSFVVGHVGRLAPEKNLHVVAEAVARFLEKHPTAFFLLVGDGSERAPMLEILMQHDVCARVFATGCLEGQDLVDAYHALDVFCFASQSETQGMVLTEAMAAGVPVVAADGSGIRDVMRDGYNGRLVAQDEPALISAALTWHASLDTPKKQALVGQARETAAQFSIDRCADEVLALYQSLTGSTERKDRDGVWQSAVRSVEGEFHLWANFLEAVGGALFDSPLHSDR